MKNKPKNILSWYWQNVLLVLVSFLMLQCSSDDSSNSNTPNEAGNYIVQEFGLQLIDQNNVIQPPTAVITLPVNIGDPLTAKVKVNLRTHHNSPQPIPNSIVELQWSSDLDGTLGTTYLDDTQRSELQMELSNGMHKITVSAHIEVLNITKELTFYVSNQFDFQLLPYNGITPGLTWNAYTGTDFRDYQIYRDGTLIEVITDPNTVVFHDKTLTNWNARIDYQLVLRKQTASTSQHTSVVRRYIFEYFDRDFGDPFVISPEDPTAFVTFYKTFNTLTLQKVRATGFSVLETLIVSNYRNHYVTADKKHVYIYRYGSMQRLNLSTFAVTETNIPENIPYFNHFVPSENNTLLLSLGNSAMGSTNPNHLLVDFDTFEVIATIPKLTPNHDHMFAYNPSINRYYAFTSGSIGLYRIENNTLVLENLVPIEYSENNYKLFFSSDLNYVVVNNQVFRSDLTDSHPFEHEVRSISPNNEWVTTPKGIYRLDNQELVHRYPILSAQSPTGQFLDNVNLVVNYYYEWRKVNLAN